MVKTIKFDNKSKERLLELLGKKIDGGGYIIQEDTGERVLATDGEEITVQEFAVLRKGSELVVRSDLISLIDFLEKYKV